MGSIRDVHRAKTRTNVLVVAHFLKNQILFRQILYGYTNQKRAKHQSTSPVFPNPNSL